MSIPLTQKALAIPSLRAPFKLISRAVPNPSTGEVVVKIASIGLNPAENHMRDEYAWVIKEYPALLGTDGAGVVVQLGEGVEGVEVGDRVAFQGWISPDKSTYQEYTLVNSNLVFKIPASISFEAASTIPLALATAAFGFSAPFDPNGAGGAGLKPFWEDGAKGSHANKPIVVLGGSSAVGQFAIQIASYMGFSPLITTASLHNTELLKSLGATHVIDRNADVSTAVKAITPRTSIEVVYDAVHTPIRQADVDLLGPKGMIVTIWPVPEGDKALDFSRSIGGVYVRGSVHLNPEPLGAALYKWLGPGLENGIIKPMKFEKLPDGLAGIEAGLDRLARREVSGVKLVVSTSETPNM